METNYHPLRRPRRKLCYLTSKERPTGQWTGKLTLGDIDGMFDDLDSSSHNDDIIPSSPLLQTFTSEANQIKRKISPVSQEGHPTITLSGPGGDVLHPARRSLAPEMDIVLNSPFKVHGPAKTSSPIQENMVVEAVKEEEDNERALVVPQILNFEEAKSDPVNTQNPQCNGHFTEEKDSGLESPPSKVTLSKATLSNHKNQVERSSKDNHPVKGKTYRKPQTPVLGVERKTSRQENTEPPVSALRQDPELPCPKKNSGDERQPSAEVSTSREKNIKAFLQKVREAEQSKPSCSRALQALIKVPTPAPELEDEFIILEDDAPLIYIPCKTSIRKRQRQKETKAEQSSADKIGHKNEELSTPEDFPGGDVVEQEKSNKPTTAKKQWLKKVDKAKEEYKDRDSKETDEETRSQKMGRKAPKSSKVKSPSKSSKDGKENAKTSKAKSLKRITNAFQGYEDIKHTQCVENMKEQYEENYADAEDLSSPSDKEIVSKGFAYGKANQNKLHVVSEESLSKDSQVTGKRKRKPPGQWWLSCPQTTEERECADNQLTLKKSKQNNKTPSAAVPSSVKAKKDSVLKRRNQKQPVLSSSENTNTTEPKNTKMTKNRITRGETLDKKKTTDEIFKATGVEQIKDQDQQQDVSDQDLDLVHSSPLVFTQRELSSVNQVFQRVYQRDSNEKRPSTPRRPRQQLGEEAAEKQRRKPPGSWWLVNGVSEDGERSPSQPQHLHRKEPRPCRQKKNQSKQSRSPRLGPPKNGNMAVSPKPLGGASIPSLKPIPLSAPRTVKRSRAMFNDIFTSATETAVSSGDTCQNNRRNGTAHPAEELSVFLQNLETPPDSKYQSENPLKELKSGPSSMIQLEQYEENKDLILSSSRVHTALSVSDLCGPPLRPLTLQPKDEANLREWFKSLWPTVAPNAAEITPDQFDWYFYQDRAIGFLLDVDCSSACIGRILLGSYMKKPLWVDHSATTVFNLLTSSVKVVINSKESCIDAGQCFTVQCGHAYSIQNVYAQPAVLYFTRILAESSD